MARVITENRLREWCSCGNGGTIFFVFWEGEGILAETGLACLVLESALAVLRRFKGVIRQYLWDIRLFLLVIRLFS
jgi:hypothetical protein